MNDVTLSHVREYLDRLDRALRDLPRDRRTEIVKDIHAHIDDALSVEPSPSATTIDDVLRSVGTPEEIAAAAYAEMPPVRPRMALRDVFTVLLLLLGGIYPPVVGWLVGVVLLWTSAAWRTKDKVIGTLLVPGGLAGAFAVSELESSGISDDCLDTDLTCFERAWTVYYGHYLFLIGAVLALFTTFWLIKHARRTP